MTDVLTALTNLAHVKEHNAPLQWESISTHVAVLGGE